MHRAANSVPATVSMPTNFKSIALVYGRGLRDHVVQILYSMQAQPKDSLTSAHPAAA